VALIQHLVLLLLQRAVVAARITEALRDQEVQVVVEAVQQTKPVQQVRQVKVLLEALVQQMLALVKLAVVAVARGLLV
jgi:hypothetical protein